MRFKVKRVWMVAVALCRLISPAPAAPQKAVITPSVTVDQSVQNGVPGQDTRVLSTSEEALKESKRRPTGIGSAESQTAQDASGSALPLSDDYQLGPGDVVALEVAGLDNEFTDETYRIDLRGTVNLPLIGRVNAAGMTLAQFEAEVVKALKTYVKEPDVVASISEFHSQPVSVLGAVNTPGVHQIQGHKTLYEVLSSAGGLRTDAGSTIRVARDLKWGAIPLPGATVDATGKFSVALVRVKKTLDVSDPAENIEMKPGDVVTVPIGEVVYVVGAVTKPGGFMMGENETMSALQVLSLAEGLTHVAAPDKAMILRPVGASPSRAEIPVHLKSLLAGKSSDVNLQANDILFIPNSGAKIAGNRAAEAAVQIATGIIMYGRY